MVDKRENFRPGDICLKGSSPSMKKGKYIICRVRETYPDEQGLVRTVLIEHRPQDSREPTLPYKSKDLRQEKISVQRLVLICRAQDILDEKEVEADVHPQLQLEHFDERGEGGEGAEELVDLDQQGGEGPGGKVPEQQGL